MQAGPLLARKSGAGEAAQHCTLAAPGAEPCGTFDCEAYFGSLETSSLGRVLFTAGAIASTQTVVQENSRSLPDGLLVVADRQIGGKGKGAYWGRAGVHGHMQAFPEEVPCLTSRQGLAIEPANASWGKAP